MIRWRQCNKAIRPPKATHRKAFFRQTAKVLSATTFGLLGRPTDTWIFNHITTVPSTVPTAVPTAVPTPDHSVWYVVCGTVPLTPLYSVCYLTILLAPGGPCSHCSPRSSNSSPLAQSSGRTCAEECKNGRS